MSTTAEKIAVMQAAERGERIEYACSGKDWVFTPNPAWNFLLFDYRVKPKPKSGEWWANVYAEGLCTFMYRNKDEALRAAGGRAEPIHVREVIE